MRIKSLNLTGFKSFYEETSIYLQSEINAVVGPNGCGKSNILDAIRWVLGEQNPRRLRAGDMEEVISNGGEVSKPLGMAEVSLVLLNAMEKGFDEVVIKRRIFRSGESEYHINGVPCRLKDITEMFMDTGVGARSYSMIDQGKIEHLITAKPEQRRALIEEVAGVVKYKARRRETESHIESTKENLKRVRDVISEVTRQMKALSKQAEDAEKFKRLSEEARRIELEVLYSKLYEIREKGKSLVNEKSRLEKEISSFEEGIGGREAVLKRMNSEILLLEQKLEGLNGEIYETKAALQAKEAMQETLESDISRVDEFIAKLGKEIELLTEENKKIGIQIEFKEESLGQVKTDLSSRETELSEKEEIVTEFKAGLWQNQSELDTTRKILFETLDKYGSSKGVALGHEKELNELKLRRERIKKEFEEAQGENERIRSKISELEHTLEDIEQRRQHLERARQDTMSLLSELNTSRELRKEKIAALSERLKEARSRLNVLKQIETNYEWLPEGIRKFLVERKGNGILGVIADFISVPRGYERALEAAFGEKLKWAIVRESEEALNAVDHLRELSIGRGTFVPISYTRRNGNFEKNGNDIVPLSDMITVQGIDKEVIEDMLNGVFVVSSLREALSLRDGVEKGASFVTLDGDLLDSGGAISGGITGEGVFERKREIEELTNETGELEKEIIVISDKLELDRTEAKKLEHGLEEMRKESVGVEIKEMEVKKDISNLQESLAKTVRKYEIIEFDLAAIDSEILEKEGRLNETVATVERLGKEKAILEQKFSELKEEAQRREEDERNLERGITSLKVEIATLIEKQKSLIEDLEELKERQKEIGEKIELERKGVDEKRKEKDSLLSASGDNKKRIEGILGTLKNKEEELSAEKNKKDELLYEIKKCEEEKESLTEGLARLGERYSTLRLELNGLEIETQHIENSIRESGLDIDASSNENLSPDYFRGFNRQSEEIKLKGIKEKIERMGPVNLLAPEEYKNLEERSKFLNEQIEDLENALSSLRKAINRIDRECRKRFDEAFQDVNKRFQEIFSRLFRGGEAKLVVTDNEDLLQSGVEIMVRPRGKKFQSVNLLSGGEKALSAIALVLSAYLVKPAPFLLFDEIDAPLDDANTVQFVDLLKEVSQGSQVIIVTHNKKTMLAADSLIGITSNKPGISKVVSVELRGS
ncbi:MAG TPA: chromosome segregation protein SMC [Thermodesulfobacteriota bacterium]|nr:chromosome segregation protein SMC [Thermodesulfobacteriota bacterium]